MSTDSVNPLNAKKSDGLGGAVFEFPAGKRTMPPPVQKPAPAHKLDLLKHIPDCPFKRYVLDVAKMTRIPTNTSLMIGLGIASSVAARCAVVTYEDRGYQPLGMYVIAEQDIGAGKSWNLSTFQAPVFNAVEALVANWQSRQKAAETAKEEFSEPFPNFGYDTDATPEGLDETLEQTRGYFALASAEQALANSISGGYKSEGSKGNKDLWLKGFNGEYHSSKRSKRKGYRGAVVGAVVNIAQPGIVNTILESSDGTGAAERCWLLSEPSLLGQRKHGREHRHYPNSGDQGYYNRVMQALTVQACQCQPIKDLPGYRLSRDDWDKIYALKDELEPHIIDGGKYSTATLKGIIPKIDINIMKIAANLAILDGCPPGLIPRQWVDAAIGMVRDYIEYIYYLLVDKGIIGTNAYEDSLISFIGDKGKTTYTQFRQAKSKVKPWAELPKQAIGQAMKDTIDGLMAKGIIGQNLDTGNYTLIG